MDEKYQKLIRKQLKRLGDSIDDKAMFIQETREWAEGKYDYEQLESLQNALGTFWTTQGTEEKPSVAEDDEKFEIITKIINGNIKLITKLKNFSEAEYIRDRKIVFDIKHKSSITHRVDKSDRKRINKIYQKHLRIQKILLGE